MGTESLDDLDFSYDSCVGNLPYTSSMLTASKLVERLNFEQSDAHVIATPTVREGQRGDIRPGDLAVQWLVVPKHLDKGAGAEIL